MAADQQKRGKIMARTSEETAEILKDLYNKEFAGDYVETFRLTWEQLRRIAGIDRLTDEYLAELAEKLLDEDFALLTFNNKFLVAREKDFSEIRALPARLAERCLFVDDGGDDDDGEEILPTMRTRKKKEPIEDEDATDIEVEDDEEYTDDGSEKEAE
jgi:hypothetical protein